MGFMNRLAHAWNVFLDRGPSDPAFPSGNFGSDPGMSFGHSPHRLRAFVSNERTMTAAMYMRLAIDCASVDIRHVKLDDQDRYVQDVKSGLHNCLNVSANIDQTGRAFLQDLYLSLFERGHIVAVPTDMSKTPTESSLFDVEKMRVGWVVNWFPAHVRVECYNEKTGMREQVTLPKDQVAVIENPLYNVMNEANSTLQRLIRKLNMLDRVDEMNSSGKLDMIIQLPYPMRDDVRRADAARRREEIQFQLTHSEYGIAYIDAQEKVTQLNRAVDNKLPEQIKDLREQVYTELGFTAGTMNGTATEAEMLNYHSRTVEPVISAVADEFKRKFLTKTARTQGHSILFFRDPFKLVPMSQLAELADKLTRNEIVTSNEFRGFIGMRPVLNDPKADMLINSNLTVEQSRFQAQAVEERAGELNDPNTIDGEVISDTLDDEPTGVFDGVNATLDEIFAELGVEE